MDNNPEKPESYSVFDCSECSGTGDECGACDGCCACICHMEVNMSRHFYLDRRAMIRRHEAEAEALCSSYKEKLDKLRHDQEWWIKATSSLNMNVDQIIEASRVLNDSNKQTTLLDPPVGSAARPVDLTGAPVRTRMPYAQAITRGNYRMTKDKDGKVVHAYHPYYNKRVYAPKKKD